MSSTRSRGKSVAPAAATAASDDRAPTRSPGLKATKEVAPDDAATSPEKLGPDPESFMEVAKDNILLKVAVALLVILAVLAALIALG